MEPEAVQNDDGWSPELAAVHLALSEEDLKFRHFARRDPDLLRRSTFHLLDSDRRLMFRQQPWPTFIGSAKLDELRVLSCALAKLIRSVPQRVFQHDAGQICQFYRLPSREVADIILSEPNCIEESMARGDLIDTADGFRCIEFNFTPNLGGWETSLLVELHQSVPETMRFVEREGIRYSYTPTLRVLFQQVIRQARRRLCDRGEIHIACVFHPAAADDPETPKVMEFFQRELDQVCRDDGGGLRGRVFSCHFGQLVSAQAKVFLGKTQIHAALELTLETAPPAVYRTFKAGNFLLFNGPVMRILSDKRNLALLSEGKNAGVFSPEERALVRRHIPWTRRLAAETVEFHGEQVFLPDLMVSARDRLVLKEGWNFGGKGVFLGRFTPEARWDEAVRAALENGAWVVQERLESLPYLYQCGESGCAPHDMIWGPFVFGNEYGGVILRVQPKAAGGAVNLSLSATEGIVLEVGGETAGDGGERRG